MKITKIIGKRYDIRKYKPEIRGINMTSGRMKMFTLPFWRCKQHNTIRYDGDILIDNVSLNDVLKDNMLFKYFHDKEINYQKDIKIDMSDYNALKETINLESFELKNYQKEMLSGSKELTDMFKFEKIEIVNTNDVYVKDFDIADLDDALGIDLSMGFMDEEDFQDETDVMEPIGLLELDEILEEQDIEKEIDTLINTFGEIDFNGIKFLNTREKKVNQNMNYTLMKVNLRPKLSCYIEMCKNKTPKMKTCDSISYIKNFGKCIELFNKNEMPQKFYNLLSIREALRNTTIKRAEVLNYFMDLNGEEILCYQVKEISNDDENCDKIKSKTKNYEQFDGYIKFKLRIGFQIFEKKYMEISGLKYHLFGINQRKSYPLEKEKINLKDLL